MGMSDESKENKTHEAMKPKKPKTSSMDQLRSQRNWNLTRLNRAYMRLKERRFFDFLTVGTSNKKPEELLDFFKLPVFSCNYLIDIRNNPNSIHTPYWNKNSVWQLCKSQEIYYLHKPNLGVPSNIRKLFFSGQMSDKQFFSWYDNNVLTEENMQEIVELVENNNVSFMCTEIGPTYCHRPRLALKLEERLGYVSFDI